LDLFIKSLKQMVLTLPFSGIEEPAAKMPRFSAFTGSARRLDGKPATQPTASTICPALKQHQPEAENNGSKLLSSLSHQQSGKLVFGSTSNQPQNETPKVCLALLVVL
jgi:ubiquitin fusion degradation protein 1